MMDHSGNLRADSGKIDRSSGDNLVRPRGDAAASGEQPDAARRWPYWLATATLIVVFLIANRPLVSGRATGLWDAETYFTGMQIAVADYARNGQLMLWNPWSNAGSPDHADPQSGAMSPILVLYGYFAGGSEAAFRWYWLLIWLWGGIGMLALARRLGAPAWGGLVVALGFVFSGFFTGHGEHTSWLHGYAFFPWIIRFWDEALRSGRYRPAVVAGALWGLTALAGHPGMVMISAGLVALWLAGRVLSPAEDRPPGPPSRGADGARWPMLRHGTRALMAFGLVGGIILSPTYVAYFVDGQGYSSRSGALDRETAISYNKLHPSAVMTLASPYAPMPKSITYDQTLFPGTDGSSIGLYTGAAVTWLALAAMLIRPGSVWRWWLAVLGLLYMATAVGSALPLRGWLYDYLPPTRYLRHATIFRGTAMFLLAVLALHACRDLNGLIRPRTRPRTGASEGRGRVRPALALAALLVLACALVSYYRTVTRRADPKWPERGLADLHFVICWGGVALVAEALALRPRGRVGSAALVVLTTLGVADALMTAQLARFTVYTEEKGPIDTWHKLDARHVEDLQMTRRGLGRKLDMALPPNLDNRGLVDKTPTLNSYTAYVNRFHLALCKEPGLVEATTAPDRIWFAPESSVPYVHLSGATFEAFLRRSREVGTMPIVIHRRSSMIQPVPEGARGANDDREVQRIGQLPAARKVPIRLGRYEPNHLGFRVEAPEAGYLLVTDRWARCWEATVDGVAAPVLGGNFIFRAIRLAPGAHRVIFRYRPRWYPWLTYLSWGTLAVVVSWGPVSMLMAAPGSRRRGGSRRRSSLTWSGRLGRRRRREWQTSP
jgi:hypothetical protein